ncbi:MAG TPA: DNA repair protein RecO [Acidimicrobiales bacterium]|nr:DNA repair protein RecO [Acidimicrobiales bacterium]
MGLYRDQGIVLRTWRLGESDRIVNLMTERHGKVRAVVKGVRKTKSRFGARLEPMTHCSMLFYEGRELDIVTQAEALEVFRPVREDLGRLAKASSLLEATDQLAQERHANLRLYTMLLGGLRALSARDSPVLVPAFFLRLLSSEGFHPLLDECAVCGERYGLEAFDLGQGGVLCVPCAARGGDAGVSAAGLDLVRRILGGDLVGALGVPAGPAVTEVERLATRAMEHHLERRLRSLPVAGALSTE